MTPEQADTVLALLGAAVIFLTFAVPLLAIAYREGRRQR